MSRPELFIIELPSSRSMIAPGEHCILFPSMNVPSSITGRCSSIFDSPILDCQWDQITSFMTAQAALEQILD